MRILLLTLVVPNPPDSGPRIKTHYVLRWLADRHEVTLVSFVRDAAEEAAAQALAPLCRGGIYTVPIRRSRIRDIAFLMASFVQKMPFLMLRDESPAMRALLQKLLKEHSFDLIHIDQLNMALFAQNTNLPVVLDEHNAVWTIFARMARQERGLKRFLLEFEWRRLRQYEAQICNQAMAVMAVSDEDRLALRDAGATGSISVIPIAVDVAGIQAVQRQDDAKAILSMATMYWPPNVDSVLWFEREVLPLIRREIPDAPFWVLGKGPPAEVRALAQDPLIEITGYVEDPTTYLQQSALLVVPLRAGGGMRVKILEALARGLPVVSTTIGAEGIAVESGTHLLIADEPADFAQAVIRILRDRTFADRLAETGRQHALMRYDWRMVCPAIETVYTDAIDAFHDDAVMRH